MNFGPSFQQSYGDIQGGVKVGSAPIGASKSNPRMPRYTPEQVVAFGDSGGGYARGPVEWKITRST